MESELLERRQASSLAATEAAEAARAELEQQLVRRQEELDEAHKKAVLCMEQMVAAQDDRMKAHQEKLVLHDRCEAAEAEVAALQTRVESQYEELRHLQAAQVEARQLSEIKTRGLQAELARAEKSRLKAMEEDDNTSQQAEALQRQAMELRESLNAAEAAKASASEKNEELSSLLVKAQQERDALEARVATLTASVEELRSSRDAEASEHAEALQQLRDQIAASQSGQEELRQQLIEARAMGVKSAAELQTTKDEARIREGEDADRLKRAETELTTLRQEVEKVAVSGTRRLEQMASENERRQKALREEMEQQSEAHREAEARIWREARAAVVGALTSGLRLPPSEPAIGTLLKCCRKQLASLKRHDADGKALGTAVNAASVLSQASWAVRQLASLTEDNSAVASAQQKTLATCAEAEEAATLAISALLHEGGTEQMTEADRDAALQEADAALDKLMDSAAELEQSVGALGSQLTQQLEEASSSVCDAQRRMEAMLAEARKALDKKTLAVHEGMLEQATALMALIQRLIHSSGALQQEIVAQEAASGKGALSTARFYKRNSRWVEGLLSAAKAVGGAAKATVDAADRALADKGKLEVMMVCGQEIAASTAQLVSASRVKARQESAQKAVLEKDASEVQEATRRLIDVVREACLKSKAPQRTDDFLKLSLVQAKRLQMDSQVRTLELESALHREQDRLRQLRRASYQLSERADLDAGDEDSEQEDVDLAV
jgi:huntingtin interacting protein 1